MEQGSSEAGVGMEMRDDDDLQQSADWDGKLDSKKTVEQIIGGKNHEADQQINY